MTQKQTWHEKLYLHAGQYFLIDKLLYKKKNQYQEIVIFKNSILGYVMAIDGIIQTTEKDEFIYHEMLTHVPMFTHGNIKNVLIIGGGDGGILREICRHKNIKHITMVEIDIDIINLCKKYFPKHNCRAYQDSRLTLVIDDGLSFIKKTKTKFDLIISDSTDPINHGKNLFSSEFYSTCKIRLDKDGIFVSQNGVPFFQKKTLLLTHKKLKKFFCNTNFYQASIPTYYGGIMTFAYATNNAGFFKNININDLQLRIKSTKLSFNYYNAKIHIGSFFLPQYILNMLEKS
ncbi:MAG: polyamine aminopropyltransferase [Buchnera aphidicola (Pentalonia nigronervosa)]|jgi:spermidine synthase|uniref:Polyamine aminopropyltransferase n=1 Tax=Buchnera aphidicola (Pentalonia nigronervosa) TaxID=1309793 RepID=A0A7H1AZM1_9GAMM|nr:MAG: polyamine aminopropyltransferase [Buchnera aphidicola (Pentalonia nigronervosa)]